LCVKKKTDNKAEDGNQGESIRHSLCWPLEAVVMVLVVLVALVSG
jgi:hypothetical protein